PRGLARWRALAARLRGANGSANGRSKASLQWEHDIIRKAKLFDAPWYLTRYPDVAEAGADPLRHYIRHGAAEGRDPHPLFDSQWYRTQAPDLAETRLSPLAHYVTTGVAQGLDPHPLFDTGWYLAQNPDVAAAQVNPLAHFWKTGAARGLDPNPLFDMSWYLEQNPDVARSGDNALQHYITHGWKEGRDPSPDFNGNWYLAQNPDVTATATSPLQHYVRHGRTEGRAVRRSKGTEQCSVVPGMDSALPTLLPTPLHRLLKMFHNESGIKPLERCYELIAAFDGFEISENTVFKLAGVMDVVRDVT